MAFCANAFLFLLASALLASGGRSDTTNVDVGLVFDGKSALSNGYTAISMGLEDFYREHPGYTTRIKVHANKSGEDAVSAASAALELLKNVKVQAILGPSRSRQARFVIDLGKRTQVPVITYSASSPSLSPTYSPYFVRMALNSSCQVNAIASIVKGFGWRQVVPVYEDTEYGIGFLPYLVDALQDVDARVPNRSAISFFATESDISAELHKLMSMQSRVFIVHLSMPLSSRFFMKAKELNMLSEGYVWIVTQGITDTLDAVDPEVIESMHGVLGLRPYVPYSVKLENFTARWREKKVSASGSGPNIFDLWAYDTSWALAMAVEKVHDVNPSFRSPNISSNPTDLNTLSISLKGPGLLQSILDTNFKGISGNFQLINGQLQYSAFQIINVVAGELREVGFWTQAHGMSQNFPSEKNSSNAGLKPIIWPGAVIHTPKGWEVKVLKVGVPVKGGFAEFVNADKMTGYCFDVFEAVIKSLPYTVNFKYVPYQFAQHPGSYESLVDQVYFENFDAVVGDVTIIANRSLYVDFTLPYTDSGVSMVVPVKVDQDKSMWIFLKPLTINLWLAFLAFSIGTGFVIWLTEHRINDDFRGTPIQQLGTTISFAFSIMVFAHKENLTSNLSKVITIFWVFLVLILTSSYTASLASKLTAQQLQPSVKDINDLLKNGDSVGYQDGSFVREFLVESKFSPSNLKNYSDPDAYEEALSNGSKNGGVSAIIDEIPYIKLFLKKHCSQYVMIGPIQKTNGFGFVFPKGSPLVPDVSRAILNVTQGRMIEDIEKKWFVDQTGCTTESSIFNSDKLELRSFWGLFLITGVASTLAIVIFSCMFLRDAELKTKMASERTMKGKLSATIKHFQSEDKSSPLFKKHAESTSTLGHDVRSVTTSISWPPPTSLSMNGSLTPSILDPAEGSSNSMEPGIHGQVQPLP